ncbi:hypothetical protein IWW50_003548 [Coemansia erecta]|nr:hypothetical protein GGF43_000582 [Coemansia sp. RSA 2618]KAJ2823973.1 hypothetical protein IWW50_003548 [Coemansia erecta]
MASEHLQESFYETLNDFPILAGNLEQTKNKHLQIVIDPNNLNLPDYKETQCDVHFVTLKLTKYDWCMLPKGAGTAETFIAPNNSGQIKLASVNVLRLKDNSGVVLFVSIPHFVVDGTGFVEFVQRWSEICTSIASQGILASVPNRVISHDRANFGKNYPEQDENVEDGRLAHMQLPSGILSRWIAGMSPETRGKLVNSMSVFMRSGNAHFYVSRSKLQALRVSIQEFVPEGQRISDNDLIMTLLTVVSAQSKDSSRTMPRPIQPLLKAFKSIEKALGRPPKVIGTIIAVNTRPRLKRYAGSGGYCGNSIVPMVAANTLRDLQAPATPELLAKVAAGIHSSVQNVDEEYIRGVVDLYNSESDYHLRPLLYDKQYTEKLFSSNLSGMGWYDSDFGWGIPEFVTFKDGPFGPIIAIMPAHPSLDGYVVHTAFSKKLDAFLRKSELWTDTAELIR